MAYSWIFVYLILYSIPNVHSIHFNTGYTDASTLEEYEDDVELVKIRFDATRPCRFFC
jgi:hypothetical protein